MPSMSIRFDEKDMREIFLKHMEEKFGKQPTMTVYFQVTKGDRPGDGDTISATVNNIKYE